MPQKLLISRLVVRPFAFVIATCAAILGFVVSAHPSFAATCTFTSAINVDFNNAGNWSCGFAPGSSSTAIIPPSTVVQMSQSATIANLQIATGSTMYTDDGIVGHDLTVLGNITSSGTLGGSTAFPGNTITVGGNFDFRNGGVFVHAYNTLNFATSTALSSQNVEFDNGQYVYFGNLTINTSANQVVFGNLSDYYAVVDNDLTVTAGRLTPLIPSLSVSGLTTIASGAYLDTSGGDNLITLTGTTTNGGTISPGGFVPANLIFGGNFVNNASGVLSATGLTGPNTITFNGDWTNSGTFSSGSSTAIFSKAGLQNIPANLTFWNLTVSSTGAVTMTGNVTTTNNFLKNGGNFNLGANTLFIQGNATSTEGGVDAGTSTVVFNGSGNQTYNISSAINNVTVNKPSGTLSTINFLDLGGVLSLQSGTLTTGSVTLYGAGTPFVMAGGTFIHQSGTVAYRNVLGATVASTTFNNLSFSPASAATFTLNASTTVVGALTNGANSTLAVGANMFTVAGLISNSGLMTESTGSIIHPVESARFATSTGIAQSVFTSPDTVYIQVDDGNRNMNGASIETMTIPVTTNAAAGSDSETITLTETGPATGYFRSGPIHLVTSSFISTGNGQIEISATGIGTASYTDVQDGTDASSTTATFTYSSSGSSGSNSGGGGGGGGVGSAGTPSLPPITTVNQTYLANLQTIGVPVHALVKLPCLTSAASADPNNACKAVYYIGTDGMRHAFPNSKVYFTWYADFSQVQLIGMSQLASIPLGKNVTYKPGVKLVKFTTDPKVYAVAKGGALRWVKTEAAAMELYGAAWNTNVDDISDAFYSNYTFGSDVAGLADFNPTTVRASVMFPSDSL